MIVTPEGLNVFPEDVERVVNAVNGRERVRSCRRDAERRRTCAGRADASSREPTPTDVVRVANAQLADHQRIRAARVWPGDELPRTEGTKKLKRHEIRAWLQTGAPPASTASHGNSVQSVIARYAGGRALEPGVTMDELGLSSLERIEMMVALEEALNTTIDEGAFSNAATVADLERLAAAPAATESRTRTGRFPVVESIAADSRAARGEPSGLSPSADARVRMDQSGGAATSEASRRSRDLRGQSSKPYGRAGHLCRIARQMAAARRAGHGEGVLQGALFSRAAPAHGSAFSKDWSTTCRPRSSTRFRFRNAKPARVRHSGMRVN